MSSLKGYLDSNKFNSCVLGLSGGIDSALSMVIAADVLGGNKVHAMLMPSQYTSEASNQDAIECANRSNVTYDKIPIDHLYSPILNEVHTVVGNKLNSITQENIQARIRGLLLMTLSNQTGAIVIATGNKSESYTGYCTLYGDTCGGYAILKDLYKTEVYELSNWRNSNIPDHSSNPKLNVIPQPILHKPPSAELRYDQKDTDSLPEYELLDKILRMLIDQKMPTDEIVQQGYEHSLVTKIHDLYKQSSYKRLQTPPGPQVS